MMQDTHWKYAKLNAIIEGVLLEPFLFLFPQKIVISLKGFCQKIGVNLFIFCLERI